MSLSYRFKVFLLLGLAFIVLSIGWSLWRWETHGVERVAWEDLVGVLRDQKVAIDSLEDGIAALQSSVEADKSRLAGISERIGHYERRASGGRLPTPEYRRYRAEIDRHNDVVERHNDDVAELQSLYARYSALVDTHNVLIDSANALQRRAMEEGFELPEARLE